MSVSGGTADEAPPPTDMSLVEAAVRCGIPLEALRRYVRSGRLQAYQAREGSGSVWRVATTALEEAGLHPVQGGEVRCPRDCPRGLGELLDALEHERVRTADLDQRLGHTMMTVGRLRGRLRAAGLEPVPEAGSQAASP